MKEERINKPPILKVGDKVRVKSKEWFDAQEKDSDGDILLSELTPGGFYFTTKMIKHCGEEFYITRIEDRESVPYYKFRDLSFNWEFWMFDLIEDVEEPEYKVGDKIIVNSIEWYNENKDDCGIIDLEDGGNFVGSMKECCGKVFTISDSYELDNQIYYHFKETGWAWQSWMFSPVKKEVSDALYHVGERVTINSKIWLAAQRLDEYGSVIHPDSSNTCRFTSTMTKYCGRTVTIDRVKVNVFGKHLYTFKEIPYMWHSYMFVPAIEEDSKKLEAMPKDSNSQSNSSEFDLTKVIYKSKRIY